MVLIFYGFNFMVLIFYGFGVVNVGGAIAVNFMASAGESSGGRGVLVGSGGAG